MVVNMSSLPFVITELFAFIAIDEPGEGVAAVQMGQTMFPLIGADTDRVDSLRKLAQHIADESGKTLTLARFTRRENLETIQPAGAP
jgi:hypothetical protein